MVGILQSGTITPGHLASWQTDGVLGDAGPNPYSDRVIASLLGADFNSTGDQPIVLPSDLLAFQLTGILIANASESLNTAVGGFYPQALKAGTAIVANSQTYTTLTTALLLMNATLSSYGSTNRFTRTQLPDWSIYFALTTAQGTACTADIYLLGIQLS
ncbi:MAG: hypothetical protein KGL39_23910 [Patescibacteria group bacterium]|nr:hypothetical protein [Patescibacteria group bacterium]